MHRFKLNIILTCIYLAVFVRVSLQTSDELRSVKKDLKIAATADAAHLAPANQSQSSITVNNGKSQDDDSAASNSEKRIFPKNVGVEIPESFKMGFYFFIGMSVAAILLILVKVYRMRLSRAERKYGVHGDRTTQELTPLPMAIEDDSDNEDHTLFDINRQIRVS